MHGNAADRRALEREALRNVINQWNANRLDLFELSEPNEDLEFHGVMRFYFQDSGQKVATKCIRVASDATVEDVIGTLVEKFRPDMRMLSVPSYALYEIHENCPERKMSPDEKPLLVQLNWHVDDREGRFLLKNVDDKTVQSLGGSNTSISNSNASFRRKLSKREKKQLKKQEKLSRMKSENGDINGQDNVAEKLYTELPETSFTRSISNPEAVMRRRRQQKLEKKLQQFRSKDGGPDTGGTLKIYGEALCKDVPYKTLLLSVRDCAGAVVREMLDKYGLTRVDPSQFCLVQVTQQPGCPDTEYVLDDDECPLSILMTAPNTGSIMFHVRRRPADCAPRKRKKKPGALQGTARGDVRIGDAPILVELGPDGSAPHPGDANKTIRLVNDVMEVGSANGIALQLYGPHIQPRHCVITNSDGVTSLTPCNADAHTYVNGQRIHQTTILTHGSLVKFGNSNTYRFLDPAQEDRTRHPAGTLENSGRIYESRSPRALSPTSDANRENVETTFDIDGNVETVSTASGTRDDNRSLGSDSRSENRMSGLDRFPRGQDPILPAVLEFPEEPQEQFLARVITHLDVTTPTFRLAPAYTLYLCARYRASTHYRPELTPTERAHKLTLLLQHAAMLIRHTVQDRSTESTSQAFWLANASELLHFLKSDRHVSAFSLQAQDTLADSVQAAFKNLAACLTDELNSAMTYLMSVTGDDHPREVINILSGAMNLLRKCRVNAALTIQLFSQLFHWISAKALSNVISNANLCTRNFGNKLSNRLRNLHAWAESQGLELAAECHLAKVVQCAHLLQASKQAPEDLANLSAACFKLNSMQLGALLMQYKAEPGEKLAPPQLLEQAAKAAESVADELARAEGRDVTLYEDPAPPLQLLLPDDGFSCDVVQGVPPGLADFLHPLQASGLCRLALQPTSSGHWTVYMSAPRSPSALSTTQPEVQVIRLHKAGGGMGLSIVAAKGAGQERLGIYIKSVVPGGAADRDGRLAAGDQLLTVDGQSLLGITQEKAAEFLVRTGTVVTLEVAKGGAVYHGLATLLQQPSPTPHRALDYDRYHFDSCRGSQESLCSLSSNKRRIFTPPAVKPKNQIFFSSDDSLFKTENRRLLIPRIEIQTDEPVFNLQVTDFSEPLPKNVTLTYDNSGKSMLTKRVEEVKISFDKPTTSTRTKSFDFAQQKSYSIDVNRSCCDINKIGMADKFLSIGTRKFKAQRATSTSMIDLSSSTSSINSLYESNLDLSSLDPDTPIKHWKSPYEIRHAKDFETESLSASVPMLAKKKYFTSSRSKSVSEENLNDKLTEYERIEILKLLHDWSSNGSESKTEFSIVLSNVKNDSRLKKHCVKFVSEPDLSPENNGKVKNGLASLKFSSNPEIASNNDDFNKYVLKLDSTQANCLPKSKNSSLKFGSDVCLPNSDPTHPKFVVVSNFSKLEDILRKYRPNTEANLKNTSVKFCSEPDFSPKTKNTKFQSEGNLFNPEDFLHECKFKHCIFNVENQTDSEPKDVDDVKTKETIDLCNNINSVEKQIKGILKNSKETNFNENSNECLYNITNLPKAPRLTSNSRRYSEVLEPRNKNFNSQLVRCDSLERLTKIHEHKKFPDAYIVSKKACKNNENCSKILKSPRVAVLRKNCVPKTWKSCSDIKTKKTVKKCCRLAKNSCPVSKNSTDSPKSARKTRSCASIEKPSCSGGSVVRANSTDSSRPSCSDHRSTCTDHRAIVRSSSTDHRAGGSDVLARLEAYPRTYSTTQCAFSSRPRRMSERDLPSRVDSERSIPSSKSVPALHQIHSPTEPPRTVSNDGYSRTSSNNSINNNSSVPSGILATSQQNGPMVNSAALRSRSTHNLSQQDGGFYQNLSIYRNKPPSPQQPLGDRTSILRSSQNSLQSSVANSQRPSSAYYPPSVNPAAANRPTNLHQSIPNLKSPPSVQRLHNIEDGRGGNYPGGNNNQLHSYQNQGNQPYPTRPNQNYPSPEEPNGPNRSQQQFLNNSPYGIQNNSYPSPTHSSTPTYPNSVQHPLSVNPNNSQDRLDQRGYNGGQGGGLLREDVFRQSQAQRHEDLMRYPSTNNIQSRTQEDLHRPLEMRNSRSDDTIRHHHPGEMMRYASSGNIRVQDAGKMDLQPLRQNNDHLHPHQQHRLSNEERILRGQAKLAEMGDEVRRRQQTRLLGPQQTLPHNYYQQQQQQQQQYYNQHLAQSMQNLSLNPTTYQQNTAYQNQGQNYSPGGYSHHSPNHQPTMTNHQSVITNHQPTIASHQAGMGNHQSGMTNHQHLANHQNYYQSQNSPSSPQKGYSTTPKMVGRKLEDAPEPPPTSTHPLYSASSQEPPKMSFYTSGGVGGSKPPIRDPWAREEQERQQEARRQAAREWQEQQIRELSSLPYRTAQQEEQLRALQLEREFQRRALETEIDQDDEDTEKESPPPRMPQPVSSQTVITSVPSTTVTSKHEPSQMPPTSILKPGGPNGNLGNSGPVNSGQIHTATSQRLEPVHPPPPHHHHLSHQQPPPQVSPPVEPLAPPPPERGSSFQVMSIRAAKEPIKRVSFDTGSQPTTPQTSQPPSSLPIAEEKVREDPNSFIRQAESMLASPTSPNEASPLGMGQATPGVIGAQEFYRDPRTRMLQEQQQKNQNMTTPVPEKLSFKEKMKMFAMETGEQETPKDKSKISRAQREIDSLGGAPQANSGLVH